MSPFLRRAAPDFWAAKEAQWEASRAEWASIDPLAWKHRRRPLREWFHERCRAESEPPLCAYCDGSLKEQARETIDHFAPKFEFPELTLAWHNLFPACDRCNETHKGQQWSCNLVRPDTDPVDDWFDLDPKTGKLRPSDALLDAKIRARVRLTIRVLGLNDSHRCAARVRMLRDLTNAWKRDATGEHDRLSVEERERIGPYRFVARRFRDAVPPSSPAAR